MDRDVVAQPLGAAGAAVVPAIEHTQPATPSPRDEAIAFVLARPPFEVWMDGEALLELAALKPYGARFQADGMSDGFGEDDGIGAGPQVGAAVVDGFPHLLAGVGAAKRCQRGIQPGPHAVKFLARVVWPHVPPLRPSSLPVPTGVPGQYAVFQTFVPINAAPGGTGIFQDDPTSSAPPVIPLPVDPYS